MNKDTNFVSLSKIANDFNLTVLHGSEDMDEVGATESAVNRPGLALSGFFDVFVPTRIQVIGRMEHIFLNNLSPEKRDETLKNFLSKNPI